ncbi:hypothetical protein CC78DRAFT_506460 [Lojkania enalia]|uniref:MFS maltose permease n=1 Tax=Lojkania enalia TaxID=147567 RepID=A0A9P4TS15_9PLEO|nr:hypothetical protein CC78DRAFT_506460 [Didymosphaeria enalia]
MRPANFPIIRIHLAKRIFRPPNGSLVEAPVPRQFSHRPPRLLILSQASLRPQLPFLNSPIQYLANGQIPRFLSISASQKKFIKRTAHLTAYYTVVIFMWSTWLTLVCFFFLSERQERRFPSPYEWSIISRLRFRRAKWWQVPENNEDQAFPNYARIYSEFEKVLKRLEDPKKDGEGIFEQDEGGILVPGVGKAGFDVTAKSREWQQGYWEVLMGMGAAAERMEGWVTDSRRRNIWSPEFIASPSNPRPKATLPGMPLPPPEDEQRPVTEPPETFYLKILTSKGFTTSQKLQAALAYADWLSFKKLADSAEEMYRWGLDIAIAGLPTNDPASVIDPKTSVLSSTAPKETITPNLVYAATSLATHLASNSNIKAALPVYISVLRARLSADIAPYSEPRIPRDYSVMGVFLNYFDKYPYPPLPPTGDEPLLRREEEMCDEAVLKNYIGEILFATAGSSTQRLQALNWIREAVSNSTTAQRFDIVALDAALRKKCQTCEEVGLESWGKIMTFLAAEAREKRDKATSGGLTGLLWKIWGTKELKSKVQDLEDEEEGVVERLHKLRRKMLKEEWDAEEKKYARTFVF